MIHRPDHHMTVVSSGDQILTVLAPDHLVDRMKMTLRTFFIAQNLYQPEIFAAPELNAFILAACGKVRLSGVECNAVNTKQVCGDIFYKRVIRKAPDLQLCIPAPGDHIGA